MKSQIFQSAIKERKRVKFLYNLNEIILEPYYISMTKSGNKVLYGRVHNTNVIKKFEYSKMFNIKVLDVTKFSPVIPILSA